MIEIKHLKTLQALRNSGSLAAAAATLHQTQSALSHQFSDLEQRLGFRLFIRKSQPLRFTPQGEILLQLANQVLPQIGRALQACNEPQQTRLRIAIECHSCIQWLTPALENFRANWPQVEMDFKSGVTFDPQPALQQDELDLVLTSDILPRSGCTTHRCLILKSAWYWRRIIRWPAKRKSRRKIWPARRCSFTQCNGVDWMSGGISCSLQALVRR
jgi:LysR family transcriptional regulator for metE and metH